MSVCGQSPLFIPTTINAELRNIDAVDVAATNLSCTTLSVKGNPISDVFSNVTATAGTTTFTGAVVADSVTTSNLAGNINLTGTITQNSGTATFADMTLGGKLTVGTIQPYASLLTVNSYIATGTPFKFLMPLLTGTAKAVLGKNDSQSTELGYDITTASGTLGVSGSTPALQFNSSGATLKATTVSGNLTATQTIQATPGLRFQFLTTAVAVAGNTEVTVKFDGTPVSTQGTTNISYSSANGTFTNSKGATATFIVYYSVTFAGVSGGHRWAYIKPSATTGNIPVGEAGRDSKYNLAQSFSVATDASAIKFTGSAMVVLAATGNFAIYVYQDTGGSINITDANITIHQL
jgi:hypothetical protein